MSGVKAEEKKLSEKKAPPGPSLLRKVGPQQINMSQDELVDKVKKMTKQTSDSRAAKRMVSKNSDTIRDLLVTLESKPKFSKMVEYSVKCLENLAVDEVAIEEMMELGLLDTLSKIVQVNPYNEKIMKVLNTCLQKCAKTPALAAKISAKTEIAAGLCLSLKKHIEVETLEGTCKTIGKLALSPSSVDTFVKGGALDGLVHVMKGNTQQGTHASALDALNKLAAHRDNSLALVQGGAAPLILSSLKMYPGNQGLVVSGISLLSKLASASPECAETLKRLGAVDVISMCLEMHSNDPAMDKISAQALRCLAGAEDVLGCLAIGVQSGNAMALALSKLSALMLVEDNVQTFLTNDGVDWLLTSIKAAVGDNSAVAAKILASGCRALQRIACSEDRANLLIQKGGVALLCEVLDKHKTSEEVASAAIRALGKAASFRPEHGLTVLKTGALKLVGAAADNHGDSVMMAESRLQFLTVMLKHDSTRAETIKEGGLQDALRVLDKFGPSSPAIAEQGLQLIESLCSTKEGALSVGKSGGYRTVVDLLTAHMTDPAFCKKGLALLEQAAKFGGEVLDQLRDAGLSDVVMKMLEAYPEDSELQAISQRALALVSGEALVALNIQSVSGLLGKLTPATAASMQDKIVASALLVSSYAMVAGNIPILLKNGGVEFLAGCFGALEMLPDIEKREKAMMAMAQGFLRLAKDSAGAAALLSTFPKLVESCMKGNGGEEMAATTMCIAAELAAHDGCREGLKGSIGDLISLCKKYPLNEVILSACVKTLSSLAQDDAACALILQLGGGPCVVECAFGLVDNREMALLTMKLLCRLAVDGAAEALFDAKAIDAILQVMARHGDDSELMMEATSALFKLLVNDTIVRYVAEKGGVTLLVKALRTHFEDEAISELCLHLLESISKLPEMKGTLLDPDLKTLELIQWIADAWGGNARIREIVARLVTVLSPPKLQLFNNAEMLTVEMCDKLIFQLQNADGKLDTPQLCQILENTIEVAKHPQNARLLLKGGALQVLSSTMKQYAKTESVFFLAASAFATITENGGEDSLTVLEDEEVMFAMCCIIAPHKSIKLSDLQKAVSAAAHMKLKPEVVENLLKNVPITTLFSFFTTSEDAMLLTMTARLLGKLSADERALEAIVSSMGNVQSLRELIQALAKNINNQDFLKFGIYLLSNIASTPEIKTMVGQEGGTLLILKVLELHLDNQDLVDNCCSALNNLTFDNEINIAFFLVGRGIEILTTVCNRYLPESEILESVVSVFLHVATANDDNKDALIRGGAAATIVETILNNFNSIDLLLVSFRVLGNLASNGLNTLAIIQAGAVQGLVAGLTCHSTVLEVIDIAIRVLTNLASEMSDEEQTIMAEEGAVQAIVEVLNSHVEDLDLETSALGCLCNLGRAQFNASMIIKQSGTEIVIKVLNQLGFDAELAEKALTLIATLALCREDIDRVIEAGAVPAILDLLKEHVGIEETVTAGLCALTNLSFCEATSIRINEYNPVAAVLACMSAHKSSAMIITAGCKSLSGLCRPESPAIGMAKPVYLLLCETVKIHNNSERVLLATFSFLCNLFVHSKAAEQAIHTSLLGVLLTCVQSQGPRPAVCIRLCGAIQNLSYCHEDMRTKMRADGVVAVMEKVIAGTAREDVQKAAKDVIAELTLVQHTTVKMVPKRLVSVKELFAAEEKKAAELTREMRNFLLAGTVIKKHSSSGNPKSRHMFVTPDFRAIVCKDPLAKKHKADQEQEIYKVRHVERGRCTPALQRKRMGKYMAEKEDACFAVVCRERTFDMEADNETQREMWFNSLTTLVLYLRSKKKDETKFTN